MGRWLVLIVIVAIARSDIENGGSCGKDVPGACIEDDGGWGDEKSKERKLNKLAFLLLILIIFFITAQIG